MSEVESILASSQGTWSREPPAQPEELSALSQAALGVLPPLYLQFLALSNGGEGSLGAEPGWFVVWPASTVIARNKGYRVFEALPGLFGFGSNGGGELLALNPTEPGAPVFAIPFIPLEQTEATLVAPSFSAFLSLLGRELPEEGGA